jgi:hypothetical protein
VSYLALVDKTESKLGWCLCTCTLLSEDFFFLISFGKTEMWLIVRTLSRLLDFEGLFVRNLLWVRSITESDRTRGALGKDESLVSDRSCFTSTEDGPGGQVGGTWSRVVMVVRFIKYMCGTTIDEVETYT